MKRFTIIIALLLIASPALADDPVSFRLDTESARGFLQATEGANRFAAGYLWSVRDRRAADHPKYAECAAEAGVDFLMEMVASTARKDYGDNVSVTTVVNRFLTYGCDAEGDS